MKIEGEHLRVDPVKRDPITGDKIEPEEAPAVETFALPVDVTLATEAVRPGDMAPSGSMRGSLGVESTAGDVAVAAATRCGLCVFWRSDDWRRHVTAISETSEGKQQIDRLRGELIGTSAGKANVEADIQAADAAIWHDFGICAAFTESTGQVTASPYYGGCGENDVRFKPRGLTEEKIGSQGYDRVLRLAQGKKE